MRIGQGFDVHAFYSGENPLILGGVKIPYIKGIRAHSDGDVLIHALIDGLLGAAALGDIGNLFPNNTKKYKAADSRILLRTSWEIIMKQGYILGNTDITIITEVPFISPYIQQIRINLINDLSCNMDQINIKATTTEKLGFLGRKEGIACAAIILLIKKSSF
ncbi:MAG: 2-C-methyl-D-erythritol 2,4-cyclodiphosphate synthase [Candidatus Dasytiphilus stammeri]